jgi:hypothetical protein
LIYKHIYQKLKNSNNHPKIVDFFMKLGSFLIQKKKFKAWKSIIMGVKSFYSPNPLYEFLRIFRCEVFHSLRQLCWWFQIRHISKLGTLQLLHLLPVHSCLFWSLWSWCCFWLLWFSVFVLVVVLWYVSSSHFGLVFLLIIVILMFFLISMVLCSSCSSWSCVFPTHHGLVFFSSPCCICLIP